MFLLISHSARISTQGSETPGTAVVDQPGRKTDTVDIRRGIGGGPAVSASCRNVQPAVEFIIQLQELIN